MIIPGYLVSVSNQPRSQSLKDAFLICCSQLGRFGATLIGIELSFVPNEFSQKWHSMLYHEGRPLTRSPKTLTAIAELARRGSQVTQFTCLWCHRTTRRTRHSGPAFDVKDCPCELTLKSITSLSNICVILMNVVLSQLLQKLMCLSRPALRLLTPDNCRRVKMFCNLPCVY